MVPLIELKNITKSYGKVQALTGLSLKLYENEIVGIIGDNGAGKSTLIKIISGLHNFDQGDFLFKDKAINTARHTVSSARKLGIETVFQDKSLGEQQSIWRNFFMGRHKRNRFGFIEVAHEKEIAMDILTKFLGLKGVGIHPAAPVSLLSGGERQGLAIGRAMHFDAKVVIMDEPTTALAVKEVDKVLSFVKKLKDTGRSGIFISHNLHHVYEVADRFFFMQHGRIACIKTKAESSPQDLIQTLLHYS